MTGEWKEYRLGDLIDVKHGFAFKGEFITTEPTNDILVTPGNFKIGGGFKSDKCKYYLGDVPDEYVLRTGALVVTMTDLSQEGDTLGYSAKIPKLDAKRFLHNQRIGLVKFNSDEGNKDFLYWVMRTHEYQAFIVGAASGTSIRHTSPSSIKEYLFDLPPFDEQRAIASVLSSLDDKIDLLDRQNKTLQALAGTLFRQWFVEEAEEGWEVKRISDVAEINKASIDNAYPQSKIEYLDTGSITEGIISEIQSLELDDAPSRAKRIVQKNDIVFSLVRPNQKHYGLLKSVRVNMIVSTGFCVISCTKIDPQFIYLLLTQDDVTEYLHSIAEASTSTYPSLLPSDIANYEFQLPPTERLKEFSFFTERAWEKIEQNTKHIRTLTQMRDTLLPKLISGEVRVET